MNSIFKLVMFLGMVIARARLKLSANKFDDAEVLLDMGMKAYTDFATSPDYVDTMEGVDVTEVTGD